MASQRAQRVAETIHQEISNLLIKGLKGVSFVADTTHQFIYSNTLEFSLGLLAVWLVVMWLLDRIKVDVLAVVVLGGTFSLALAFASNDLVNFIGVPLAGLHAYQAAQATAEPLTATMGALAGKVHRRDPKCHPELTAAAGPGDARPGPI